jgi:hypothetical protein
MKREKLAILVVPIKIVEPVVEVIAQPIKPTKVPLKYPCIICYSYEHHEPNCPRKTKVHNMF